MVYPLTAAGTEDEGPVPRLDAGVTSQPGPKTRRKRGESMSFGYGDHGHFRPLSPPLSLETLTGSETKTSFFSSPSLHNDTTDATHSSPQSESTFRTCSRTSSPPPPSVSRFTRGIPFSEMLDLATAKAENITGLYYAKQMNRKSAPQLLMRDSKSGVHIPSTDLHPPQAGHCEHLRLSREGSEVGTEVSCKSYSQSQRGSRAGAHNGRQDITPSITQSSSTLTSTGSSDPLGLSSTSSDTQDNSGSSACSSKPQPASPCSQHRRSHSASHFFHLSSLKHHSPAQFNLALCYEHGKGGVNKDLEKAIHFYQQAADQGHTKASYNMGCICYNHGELSKAIAWFERAGKCSVRGLGKEAADQLQTEWNRTQLSSKLPAPRQSTPIHELESMLLGDLATTSGPFAAYLPAILCLALLCRQGVLTKDRETILRKDQSQAMELLHNLLQNASQRPRGNMEQDCPRQHSPASSSNDTGEDNMPGLARSNNRDPSKLPGHLHSSILYSSCPSLPLRNEMPGVSPSSPSPQPPLSSTKSSATTEGEMRDDIHGIHGNTHEWSLEHDGADDHEIWSIILARQLLNAWKPEDTKAQLPGTEIPAELERRNKTILRHHLLYITNPTLGKNLYNLGVLYDLYLGEAEMAIRCYRSAYHNSLDGSQLNSQQHPSQSTRINSAWNLGVLHVRRKEWKLAQRWFLHAQHDIVLLERQQQCGQQDITIHGSSRIHPDDVSLQKSQDGLPKLHRRSMVNVIPECKASLPSDSPGKRHARKHGLMMHLDAIASMSHRAESSPNIGVAQARRESRIVERTPDLADDGIRTDATKISWVLRWVEFQMNVS
ncbi:hypothetical protein BGX31_002321 [Mortierella sp. GBA43]|nr:hypothetical protein BGX31_002321 [Mortierella sp. GBA43]